MNRNQIKPLVTILLFLTSFLISCKDNEKSLFSKPELKLLSEQNVYAPIEGGTFTILYNIENAVPDSEIAAFSEDSDWIGQFDCTVDGEIKFVVQPNEGTEDRSAVITVNYSYPQSESPVSFKVNVVQSSKEPLPDVPMSFDLIIPSLNSDNADMSDFSSWENGDVIGVFAVESGLELSGENIILNNLQIVYSDGRWIGGDGKDVMWPPYEEMDFYAYYPYSESNTDPLNVMLSVSSDQSNIEDFGEANVMFSKIENIQRGDEIKMEFTRPVSLIEVSIPGGKGYGASDNLDVYLNNSLTSLLVNFSDFENSEVTNNLSVKMMPKGKSGDEYIYQAWIPSQTYYAGVSLFLFNHEGRQEMQDDALIEDFFVPSNEIISLERNVNGVIHTVRIEPGTFTMGTPESESGHTSSEMQHTVILSEPFYMSLYEVTNSQFADFLNDVGVTHDEWWDSSVSGYVEGYGEHTLFETGKNNVVLSDNVWVPAEGKEMYPVSYVSWYGAKAYADWAGADLPTEAQWEYACRAGSTTTWSFGDDASLLGDYSWYDANSPDRAPSEVGTKLPNQWGLYDMHGNLYEWCLDYYDSNYGITDLGSGTSVTDPKGPETGFYKVIRGGSWFTPANYLRSGYRNVSHPEGCSDSNGFRIVFKSNK